MVLSCMVVHVHMKLSHLKSRVKKCLQAWEFLEGPDAKRLVQHEELIY